MKNWKNVWDLLVVFVLSILLIPIVYIFPESPFRIVIGLPFILFFPGYALICFLFPEKSELATIERAALSGGLSIAITSLMGLALYYTFFGLKITSTLLSLVFFNIIFSLLAVWRRFNASDPFIPNFEVKKAIEWEKMEKFDKVLTVVLLILIISSIFTLIYIIVTPKQGEVYTEFYILGSKGKAADYPTELIVGQNATIIIGLANHEHRTINYFVEIWLINMSYENNNNIVMHQMYFFDRFNVTLDHTPVNIESNWTSQWEVTYTFSIDKPGEYRMWFLLFKDHVPPLSEPRKMKDYAGTDAEKRIFDAVEGKIQSLYLNIAVKEL